MYEGVWGQDSHFASFLHRLDWACWMGLTSQERLQLKCHQILPEKVKLHCHQILPLSPKVTLHRHQILLSVCDSFFWDFFFLLFFSSNCHNIFALRNLKVSQLNFQTSYHSFLFFMSRFCSILSCYHLFPYHRSHHQQSCAHSLWAINERPFCG